MELTCWWNQLWIIFMNMKSITAAQHQQHTIQFQSFLWEWKDWIECVCWAGCGTKANSNSGGIADCLPRRVWLMECLSPRLLFEWVRGGCRPQRSARRSKRRERERHEFNQTKATQPIEQSEIEWSWRIERECRWSKPIQKINSLSEEKWIYCWMALPAPSNGAPSSNSCAASPTTLSFFCRPAEAPSKRKKRVDWLGCLALPSTNERFSICWMEWAAGEEKKSIKWSWKGLVEFNPAPLIDFSSFNQVEWATNKLFHFNHNWWVNEMESCVAFFSLFLLWLGWLKREEVGYGGAPQPSNQRSKLKLSFL